MLQHGNPLFSFARQVGSLDSKLHGGRATLAGVHDRLSAAAGSRQNSPVAEAGKLLQSGDKALRLCPALVLRVHLACTS